MSASGMMPPPKTTTSVTLTLGEQLHRPGEQGHMRAGENGQPDGVGIFLDDGLHDLLGRLVQAGVDDLHAGIAQCAGDDLGAPVVTVQARLGDDDPDALHPLLCHAKPSSALLALMPRPTRIGASVCRTRSAPPRT